jgi:hypothetical protein
MSAPTRREFRRASDPHAVWLSHALSTQPADRAAAEDAITGLYALLNRPRPEFVWVDSPAAAVQLVPPPELSIPDYPPALENELASLVFELRQRLPPQGNDPLRRLVRESITGMIRGALPDRIGLAWFGQHDAHYSARFAQLTQAGPAARRHMELWAEITRSCGWWWPREGRCVIAERPSVIRLEDNGGETRLHSADGPAVLYRDGWAVHAWHGTRVPSWVIDGPTVELVAAERNIEVRRCAIERWGWAEFITEAGLDLVGTSADPGNPGCELRLYDLPYKQWGSPTRLLLAINGSLERDGTRRQYGLRVPPWFEDPVDAAGWSYGLTGAQYALLQRRT